MNPTEKIPLETSPFKECLADYCALKGPDLLADYMDTTEKKVRRWIKHPPHGEEFLLAAYFLVNEGYMVKEFAHLPQEVFNFGKLLFARYLTIDGAVSAYPEVFPTRVHVTNMFRDPPRMSEKRRMMSGQIFCEWKERHPDLGIAPLKIVDLTPTSPSPERSAPAPKPVDVQSAVSMDRETLMKMFASLVDTGTMLGKIILSEFTAEERYALRVHQLAGGKLGVFADIVNALTSERAREMMNEKTPKKKA